MSNRTIYLNDALYEYLLGASLREPDVLRELRDETRPMPEADCQISPEQGQFMALLLRVMGAKRVLEVGTFTGYSSLAMALALPENGKVITCDRSETWTAVARRYWRKAGVEGRIELRLGEAQKTLTQLRKERGRDSFDFAFIDADKTKDGAYFEQCMELVRSGGIIAIDNTLWSGRVADRAKRDADTRAIRAFNAARVDDQRIDLSLVPIADGLTLCRKR
ncbi:methyltransferase domain-containing protein [candidate division WOR-3 bacterium]|uniref:Methyltransferase domain-containing protein n=1 Tax=candidate division WOR-3 bacterium TaxID=2052148 RepID=A0A937XF91_UNCW3|nr:methyltransferase domain-containing protein [candidate division WOR-3 bacterium]